MNNEEVDEKLQGVEKLLQTIIVAVARKTHQGISPDDPVMTLPIIMKVLADDAAEQHKRVLLHHANEHEDIALRWRTDAEETAERIINACLTAGQEQITVAAAQASQAIREGIQTEMAGAVAALREENEAGQKTFGPMILVGGVLSFLGGAAALAAVVLKVI